MKDTEDDGIAVGVAQADRFGGAGDFIALGFVVAEHIRAQRAFLVVGAGRLVVGNFVRRDEQRGDRVDQR